MKITPNFTNIFEIRMGSPFNCCELSLSGNWVPELPKEGWQDKFAHDPSGRYLALILWDNSENSNPGFCVVVIDSKEKKVEKKQRIEGCCKLIEWNKLCFSVNAFHSIKVTI